MEEQDGWEVWLSGTGKRMQQLNEPPCGASETHSRKLNFLLEVHSEKSNKGQSVGVLAG